MIKIMSRYFFILYKYYFTAFKKGLIVMIDLRSNDILLSLFTFTIDIQNNFYKNINSSTIYLYCRLMFPHSVRCMLLF